MLKFQYGFAGFIVGAFLGLMAGLAEMRIINGKANTAGLFMLIAGTILVCGIAGLATGRKIADREQRRH